MSDDRMTERRLLELPERYAHEGPVPTPCIGVCRIDERTSLCAGCFRSLDEIADWSSFTDDEKRAVWAHLPSRYDDCAAATFTSISSSPKA